MNDKFKVCHGLATKLIAIILGIVNIGAPIGLIVRTIVIWEGVGQLVGMCFVALLVMLMFSLPAVLLNIMAWDYVKIEGTKMTVRKGLRTRFVADCSELNKVKYKEDISSKGRLQQYIILGFEGRKEIDIAYNQKNIDRFREYIFKMRDAGRIAGRVEL